MELDLSGLNNRVFDALAETAKRRYIYMCNMKTNVSRWSKNAVEYFGLPGEYFKDAERLWADYVHPDDRQHYLDDIQAVLSGKKKYHDVEYRAKNKDGNYVVCSCRGVIVRGENGEPDLFAGTLDNHGLLDNVDPVTNLYNGYAFLNALRAYCTAGAEGLIMAVGINEFTNVNAIYGYALGNQILSKFGDQLYRFLKNEGCGTLYRMDGAKFAICAPHMNEAEAERLYAQIREIAHRKIWIANRQIPLTVSAGAVLARNFSGDEYAIQASVISALRRSKKARFGQLVFFDNEQADSARKDLELMEALQKSIVNHCEGFYLCYQPIVRADTGRIVGMEALLRWNKEPYGEVPPGRFIPWLENDLHFYELGRWILRQAITDAAVVLEKRPDFFVNVNVAYTQMERAGFRDTVLELLRELRFPPQNLHLELTERCRSLRIDYLQEEMKYFKSCGIRMVLDDFGIEGSSLELLGNLPIDHLKIDRSFVSEIESDPVQQTIVEAVLNCAEKLRIQTCIEGIETDPMRRFLLQYPASYHQGYFYSRPVRFERFLKLLEA